MRLRLGLFNALRVRLRLRPVWRRIASRAKRSLLMGYRHIQKGNE